MTPLTFVGKAEESFRVFKGNLEFGWPKGFLLALAPQNGASLLVRNDTYTRGCLC